MVSGRKNSSGRNSEKRCDILRQRISCRFLFLGRIDRKKDGRAIRKIQYESGGFNHDCLIGKQMEGAVLQIQFGIVGEKDSSVFNALRKLIADLAV